MVNRGTLINSLALFGYLAEAKAQAEQHLKRSGERASTASEIRVRSGIHSALSVVYALQGEPARSRRCYAACIAAREATGDHLSLLAKQQEELALVMLPYGADDLMERARLTDEAERTARRLMQTGALRDTHDPRFSRILLLVLEGRWYEARALAEQPDGSYFTRLIHFRHFLLGTLARAQGDAETAWQCVRASWPRGPTTEPGTPNVPFKVSLLLLAAALALDAGDLSAARGWLDAHRRWLDFMDATLGRAESGDLEAEWYRAAGDTVRARAHSAQALAHATSPRQPLALLAAHRTLGILATDAGDRAAAEEHFAEALTLADACRAPYERALTLIDHTELLAATDEHRQAHALLDDARELCLPMDAMPALARIERLAARLDAGIDRPPAGLTAREVEVLRLMAAGLSNAEIAERLFLSPRTVKAHVANSFAKIGVHNRAAATEFVLRHGLA
jgi:DNA-binding NarL/FixJ family response regulator